MTNAEIYLAEGFEDVEALGVRDILIRGGVDVRLVSVGGSLRVVSSHGLAVEADCLLGDSPVDGFMIFPGGMPGSRNLGACRALIDKMNRHYGAGGSVAAICAAPAYVLGQLDGIGDASFTCYDGCETDLVSRGARFEKKPFVRCGRIITGRGPGHATDFALAILEDIAGPVAAARVASQFTLRCDF